jgi:concentrative nucleoside transporter, CNT family
MAAKGARHVVHGLGSIVALLFLAWTLSEDRTHAPARLVVSGVLLQLALAILFIKFPAATALLVLLNDSVIVIQAATDTGTGFVFGYLGGGPLPFAETHPGASSIFAFRVLPLVLVVSVLASLFFYWGILQRVVAAFALLLRHTMGIAGPLGFGAACHIFVGVVEASLLIRPYLARMERGEIFALMTCGMAGLTGTVMVLNATVLKPVMPDALSDMLIASVISTPAALVVAGIMVPFRPLQVAEISLLLDDPPLSTLDAIAKGTTTGISLLLNIGAMLIVAIALVGLVNKGLGLIYWDTAPLTLQRLFAFAFRPVMWLIGIPWAEVEPAATLMGTKTVINEYVAYGDLARLPPDLLSHRSRIIMTYALCGFANFGSAGIVIGSLSLLVPERKGDILDLSLRSILSGTIATCMSGAVVGMLQS